MARELMGEFAERFILSEVVRMQQFSDNDYLKIYNIFGESVSITKEEALLLCTYVKAIWSTEERS